MPWYSTGTLTVAANGTTATGAGTAFLSNVRVGDGITIAGSTAMHEVTGVTSDTQLTFQPPYAGAAGSGKAYRCAPMLGYDKDLSDAFNAIRLQWGDELGSLQPWAYAPTAAQARTQLGLGSAAIRNALGSTGALYSRDSILGTVSQSGGIPTGAIIERGNNANGEYVRYADGTQICGINNLKFEYLNSSVYQTTWFFPAGFSAEPIKLACVREFNPWPTGAPGFVAARASSALQTNIQFWGSGLPSTFIDASVNAIAIGRWY